MKIETLRKEIDQLDHQMIKILAQRMKIVQKIANEKIKHTNLVRDIRRENGQDLLVLKLADEIGLAPEFVLKIFGIIRKESRKIQSRILKMND